MKLPSLNLRSIWRRTTSRVDSVVHIKRRRQRRRAVRWSILVAVLAVGLFSYATNPFVRFSVVVDPYTEIRYEEESFVLEPNSAVLVQEDAFFKRLALVKSGWHIFSSKLSGGKKARQATVDEIIRQIHLERFDPQEPFLISGDHFSVLYPRSLGIFYHSLLDARTALNEQDWQNRQRIYLKTLAYALQAYEHAGSLSTTIVPVGPRSVVLLNFYALPSDTLYSLLFALEVMQDEQLLIELYPFSVEETPPLQTQRAAQALLEQHRESLTRHYYTYMDELYDPTTGLVRTDEYFSGTKDIVHRSGAFYENVMVWKTTQQAMNLGLIERDPAFLADYKQRILDTYWDENEGIFIEDLSSDAIENAFYSSDWLIAYQTGFLDPENPDERLYLERSVDYIQRNAIDQPFGLQYHPDPRRNKAVFLVRVFAPDYASTAIWSHWGMEYIKLLTHLGQVTGETLYLEQADQQLSAYAYNIKRYRGYPEVYDSRGDFFRQTFYKSIRQTGWIVNYEQARAMFHATTAVDTAK